MTGFWQRMKPRERVLLLLLGAAVVIGVPMLLSPPPASGKKLLPAREARQKYREAVDEKARLEAEVDRLTPQIEKLTYAEAPEQILPGVVRQLQDQAKKAGIRLREVKPLRSRRMSGVTKVPVSVRFVSRFDQSVPFLYAIEDPGGKLVVEKLNVSAPDPRSRLVDVEVQVALFTRAEPPAASDRTASRAGG